MYPSHALRTVLAALCTALFALTPSAFGATHARSGALPWSHGSTTVFTDDGAVRGLAVVWRLRVPRPAVRRSPDREPALAAAAAAGPGSGIRDATAFAPSCPQPRERLRAAGPVSEDCLYLNVSTPTLHRDAAPARAGVDPRRRLHPGRGPQLRRREARRGRHGRRHHQLPARRPRLPGPPGAGQPPRRPGRQLRPDGPAGRAALGAAQHRRSSAATRTT